MPDLEGWKIQYISIEYPIFSEFIKEAGAWLPLKKYLGIKLSKDKEIFYQYFKKDEAFIACNSKYIFFISQNSSNQLFLEKVEIDPKIIDENIPYILESEELYSTDLRYSKISFFVTEEYVLFGFDIYFYIYDLNNNRIISSDKYSDKPKIYDTNFNEYGPYQVLGDNKNQNPQILGVYIANDILYYVEKCRSPKLYIISRCDLKHPASEVSKAHIKLEALKDFKFFQVQNSILLYYLAEDNVPYFRDITYFQDINDELRFIYNDKISTYPNIKKLNPFFFSLFIKEKWLFFYVNKNIELYKSTSESPKSISIPNFNKDYLKQIIHFPRKFTNFNAPFVNLINEPESEETFDSLLENFD